MGSIYFNPGDMAFIQKMGYDGLSYRNDLSAIYRLDQVFENDLHMSLELDEAPFYYIAKMLDTNPRYAATFVDVAAGYEKIAANGNLLAKCRLACMYRFCTFESLRKKALEYAKEAAEAGMNQARLLYGIMTSDPYWVRKAADDGYPFAQHELGLWYYDGENGVRKDREMARMLWRKANISAAACDILWDKYTYNTISTKEGLSTVKVFMSRADYHRKFDCLAGIIYESDNNYYEAYRCYKKAVDCGMNYADQILQLYDKGFSGIEPRSYWQEKHEELKQALGYGHLMFHNCKKEKTASSEKSSTTSQTTSSGSTYSIMSYYMASEEEKKKKKKQRKWIIILVLIAAVAAVKFIF